MGLFGRNTTTVGLDIGSGLIKLVAISHASGGPVLTKVAFTSVVNDAIVEGEVMDPAIVAEAIKGLMASAGIKGKKVRVIYEDDKSRTQEASQKAEGQARIGRQPRGHYARHLHRYHCCAVRSGIRFVKEAILRRAREVLGDRFAIGGAASRM